MAKKVNPKSLDNLVRPIKDKDDPRIIKAHSPEANAKRSESMKKTIEKKKAKKQMKEDLIEMLSMKTSENENEFEITDISSFEKLLNTDLNVQADLLKTLIIEAKNGNMKAFELIRDTIGEKPADNTNLNVMAESAKGTELLMNAFLNDDDDEEDD